MPRSKTTLKLFAEKYPRCFHLCPLHRWPLKVGIHIDLLHDLNEPLLSTHYKFPVRRVAFMSGFLLCHGPKDEAEGNTTIPIRIAQTAIRIAQTAPVRMT